MFENPYESRFQLFQKYLDITKQPVENRFMARGKKLEPMIREAYMKKTRNVVEPGCYEHPAFPHLRCSADGVAPVQGPQLVCEIKCPDKIATHLWAREEKKVPGQYYGQCQHLLMVTGAECLDYASFWHGELVVIAVKPDEEYIDRLMAEEHAFWKMLCDGRWVAPEGERDLGADEVWQGLVAKFKEWDLLYQTSQQNRDYYGAQLAQLCGMNQRAYGAGVEVKWTHTVRGPEPKPRGPIDSWSLRVEQVPDKRVD
jgi:putative phage-type endonuclease